MIVEDALRPHTLGRPRRAGRVKSAAPRRRERGHAQLASTSEHGELLAFNAAEHRGALPLCGLSGHRRSRDKMEIMRWVSRPRNSNPRTTQLYDGIGDGITLDEVARIAI